MFDPVDSTSPIPSLQGSLEHHRFIQNQFPIFFFSVLHCPPGLGKLQACPFPDAVFPPLFLSALSSSPFHCALPDGFGQTWWTGDIFIPLQFGSLFDGQEVFVSCWILARVSSNIFLYACESWTLKAELHRRIRAMEIRCYRNILRMSYNDHVTNEEVRAKIHINRWILNKV